MRGFASASVRWLSAFTCCFVSCRTSLPDRPIRVACKVATSNMQPITAACWEAYVSYYFMDGCFGITSIFIPLFTLLVGVKLMGAYRVRLWKWFLNFSILMIWGSLLFSLITSSLPDEIVENFSFRLGGSHGEELNSYLSTTLGTTEPGCLCSLQPSFTSFTSRAKLSMWCVA